MILSLNGLAHQISQYYNILLYYWLADYFFIYYITFGPLFIKRVSKVKATAPHTYSMHLSSLIEPKPIKKIAVPIIFTKRFEGN